MVIVAPIASRVGQYFLAIVSLTIATGGAPSLSLDVNARPRTIGMPSTSKYRSSTIELPTDSVCWFGPTS